jgi:hypothetical protein
MPSLVVGIDLFISYISVIALAVAITFSFSIP